MTKFMMLFCLIVFASCAHQRGPASVEGNPVAYDSMALGNVTASAVKRYTNHEVCFDIKLTSKNVKQEQVQASNWTMAWVDSKKHYHLLPVSQRQPASTPQGGVIVAPYGSYTEYTNNFTTCTAKAVVSDMKGLVLTPKEFPYSKKDSLKLTWNE